MKKLVLITLLVALVGISSLSLAFDVTVSVQDENGANDQYRVVEMRPVQEDGIATAANGQGDVSEEAMIAEKD